MHKRIRAGVTGLACVFLIVLLAAAFLNLARERDGAGDLAANSVGNSAVADTPKDPLAELGVAPDAAPEPATPAVKPPPRPAP